jgi:hypothetical protein
LQVCGRRVVIHELRMRRFSSPPVRSKTGMEDMTKNSRLPLPMLAALSAAFMTTAGFAKTAANSPQKLTPEGERAMAEYTAMLDGLRVGLKSPVSENSSRNDPSHHEM